MSLIFPTPPLRTSTAHLLTFLFTSSYVGLLYLSKKTRLSFSNKVSSRNGPRRKHADERWRDDPDVIKARLVLVTFVSVACCGIVFLFIWYAVGLDEENFNLAVEGTLSRLGFTADFTLQSIRPHLVTPVLFLGPLYARYLLESLPFQRRWTFTRTFVPTFFSWMGARNYLFGPITEEIVFRACIICIYHLSGASTTRMIFLTPLTFGAAHAHHGWETFNLYGRTASAAKRAIVSTLFQLAYTTLFGFHCVYLFLRSSSILPPITAHIFCNIMGIPQISWEMERFPQRKAFILLAYIIGIIGFIYGQRSWTLVDGGIYWRPAALMVY